MNNVLVYWAFTLLSDRSCAPRCRRDSSSAVDGGEAVGAGASAGEWRLRVVLLFGGLLVWAVLEVVIINKQDGKSP
ncbi:MAG: hypothetical protein CM15mP74_03920 [Halieaceae bacterium]|nr:MAG: hypothetical protein CM15mP74_03920 [Halieaceae bacterium]